MEIVAWRGNSHQHLENTAEAVAAVPSYVRIIEIDTRLTRDGRLVAFHSPTMAVHGYPYGVDALSWEELQGVNLQYHKRYYAIPLVEDLVRAHPDKTFMLHVKRENDVQAYVAAVASLPHACWFHSNSEEHLLALRHASNVAFLFKSIYMPADDVLDYVDGYMLGHRAFGPYHTALETSWLKRLRDNGKVSYVFASMLERWMREVIQHDVDGFLTGRFDRAARVLGVPAEGAQNEVSAPS